MEYSWGHPVKHARSLVYLAFLAFIIAASGCKMAVGSRVKDDQAASPSLPRATTDALNSYLAAELKRSTFSGVAAAVIQKDNVLWSQSLGVANREAKTPLTPDGIWVVASISKTITSVAVMQQFEAGKFKLDDDINAGGYLPFRVRNPRFPNAPITFRQLLTHRSSLLDVEGIYDLETAGDSSYTLGTFLNDYFNNPSKYPSSSTWATTAPNSVTKYTNVGVALLGYLVERMTNTPFDQYCKDHIFRPLGMTTATWRLTQVPTTAPLVQCYIKGKDGRYERQPRWGMFPYYPASSLQISIGDMAIFLGMMANGGTFQGKTVLKPDTVAQMISRQVTSEPDGYGLIWLHLSADPDSLVGHEGSIQGTSTTIAFRPSDGAGALYFYNDDQQDDYHSRFVLNTLIQQAAGGSTGTDIEAGTGSGVATAATAEVPSLSSGTGGAN